MAIRPVIPPTGEASAQFCRPTKKLKQNKGTDSHSETKLAKDWGTIKRHYSSATTLVADNTNQKTH